MNTGYLTYNDYLPSIQDEQLGEQLLDAGAYGRNQLAFAESWATGQVRSKLKAKYDLDFEFTPTLSYDPQKVYYAGQRVIINFPDWIEKIYSKFDVVVKDGIGYICNVDQSQLTFEESEWQSLGEKNTIYYIPLPYKRFSISIKESKGVKTEGFYNVGDIVWWEDHIYKCLRKTVLLNHETYIQNVRTNDVQSPNVFPNDPDFGKICWEDLGLYQIPPYYHFVDEDGEINTGDGTFNGISVMPSASESVWTIGDNRDPVIMQVLIDLSLWMLCKRLAPNNIPELRESAKNDAFAWLSSVKSGKDDTDLSQLQPEQGMNFRWGSQPKQINFY